MSIQTKIIVPVIAATVLLVALVYVIISIQITQIAEDFAIAREESVAESTMNQLWAMESRARFTAYSITSNPYFLEIYRLRDQSAMCTFICQQKEIFNLDFIVLTDNYGKVLLRSYDRERFGDTAGTPGIAQAMEGRAGSAYITNDDFPLALYSAAGIFDAQGRVIGTLSAGYNLATDTHIVTFANMFDAEVAFFVGEYVVATTLRGPGGQPALGSAPPGMDISHVLEAVLGRGENINTQLTFAGMGNTNAFFYPLMLQGGDIIGMLFVAFSREEANAAVIQLQRSLLIMGATTIIIMMALLINALMRFVKPLKMLTNEVLDISGACVEAPALFGSDRDDELGELSRSIEQMRNKLVTLTRDAQAVSQSKSRFLSIMSHEMRTPMNAIVNMVSIGTSTPLAHKKQYALDKIGSASDHLLGVINDVLDISKIEANKFILHPIAFNLKRSVGAVVNVIRFAMDEKEQNLVINIDPNVPRYVVGDNQRYMQVLTNILSNAVKFTPNGGIIELNIAQTGKETNRYTILTDIKDTGIGMNEEQQSRVFELFEQAEPGTMLNYGGTGLGLTISKQIVSLMGGEINVESELGKGTTFSFTVIFKHADERDRIHLEEAGIANLEEDIFKGKTVLLVEDIEMNREIVFNLLADTKLTMEYAEDGAKAVEMYKAEPLRYDLIFMDIQMPNMNGYEATRYIREAQPPGVHIPIIAMTANVFKEEVEKCLASGMDDHIGKPIDRAVVVERLVKWLS